MPPAAMAPLALDHLVLAARTLTQGLDWCEATLGIRPDAGGRHASMGTHNRVFAIGQGSGICACAAARAQTGVGTRIVGVVSAHATAYQQSFRAGRPIEAPVTTCWPTAWPAVCRMRRRSR